MTTIFKDTLSMIGNTPIVELTEFDTGCCRLFVKLENKNPGGSIKDRIALSMVEAAEREGQLKPGGTIIEATAGNTGIALGLVASLKGYKLKIVMPDKMSPEKVAHLRALGAEVIITRSDVVKGHPEYYQDMAQRLASEMTDAFYIDQFNNPNNPLAHERTTAPEIWEQMQHDVDAIVCGVGSGGTLSGIGRYFKRTAPQVEMIVADPNGSIIADMVNKGTHETPGSWLVEGIGEDFVPSICDLSLTHKAYYVSDQEAIQTAYDLLRLEGILAGSSTGTLLAAALRYCKEQTTPKRVITFVCDTGDKYLSKMYNAEWLKKNSVVIK